jgi:hypothetical protein
MTADNHAAPPLAAADGETLQELAERLASMRRHHARIIAGLKDGVYPVEEAEKVGALADDLAAQVSALALGWRDAQ